MLDLFYIIITCIFALFILFCCWWLYKALRSPLLPEVIEEQNLTENQKEILYEFCANQKGKPKEEPKGEHKKEHKEKTHPKAHHKKNRK